MTKILHVWFDVDNTLYRMPPEAEAEIFARMYHTVQKLKKWSVKHTHKMYDGLYGKKDSHSWVFSRLSLPVDQAREVYRSVKMKDYVKGPDKKLISLLDHLDKTDLPYSFYTNNFLDAVIETFDVLGVDFKRFVGKLTGDAHNKALGTKGYDRVIEVSEHDDLKRRGSRADPFSAGKIMYVGDREDLDIAPAKYKGMQTALVVWPDGKTEEERSRQMAEIKTSADFKLPDVYSLAEVVDRLTRR